MESPEIQRFRAERAAMKERMRGQLSALGAEARKGDLPPEAIQDRFNAILLEFLGPESVEQFRPRLDELMTRYAHLQETKGQLAALEELQKLFDQFGG
ncbi:MAG TPA: hypothetical protein VGU02_08040 [Gaiellaceae bacterium]|nr:hypothetical protein [Gaiellaceae bacterium]